MQARLAATDLACRRGERLLFRGVSFDCQPGAALQIAGPNGVGKSSLIRILAGLMRPCAGSLDSKGAMGLVDERLALDSNLPLGKALAFYEKLDGCRDPARAAGVLQLETLMDVPVRYLSTGQKKRAALARLINLGCPIWLLDEPLNGLDAQAIASSEELIAEHCAGGGIAVFASHQALNLPVATAIDLAKFAA